MFLCSVCNKPVLSIRGEIKRVCDHEGKAIIADLKATVYGQSKVNKEAANGVQKRSTVGSST